MGEGEEMKITVTERDIKNGKRNDGWENPVALAVSRAVLFNEAVWMTPTTVSIVDVNTGTRLTTKRLSRKVTDFVRRFDNGEPVEPISFEIDL